MASVSKSQTSKRKETSNKIKIQMNGTSAKVIHDEESDGASSDDSGSEGAPAVKSKGKDAAQDDAGKKKKEVPARIDTSVLDNVTCTACGRQLNPYKNSSVHKHPELRVIICKKCDKFLSSGKIAKDSDGMDEQCRWCGEGGRLVVCDHCSCAFCKACVMRNFNRSEFNNINDQPSWKCYICDKSQLQGLRENYRNVRDTMKALQAKEKEKGQTNSSAKETQSQSRNGRISSGKSMSSSRASKSSNNSSRAEVVSPGDVADDDSPISEIALNIKDLEVEFMNVDVIMDKLSTATNTFREMLRALRSQFHTTSPRRTDDAPPQFEFSLGSALDTNSKKKRCAKALNSGLIRYFHCLRKILQTENHGLNSSGILPSSTAGLSQNSAVSSRNSNVLNSIPTDPPDVQKTVIESSKQTESCSSSKDSTRKTNDKLLMSKSFLSKRKASSETSNSSSLFKRKDDVSSHTSKLSSSKNKDNVSSSETPNSSSSKRRISVLSPIPLTSSSKAICSDHKTADKSSDPPAPESDVLIAENNGGQSEDGSENRGKGEGQETNERREEDAMEVDDENVAAKLDMIKQLAMLQSEEGSSESDANGGDDDNESQEKGGDVDKEETQEVTNSSSEQSKEDGDKTEGAKSKTKSKAVKEVCTMSEKDKPPKDKGKDSQSNSGKKNDKSSRENQMIGGEEDSDGSAHANEEKDYDNPKDKEENAAESCSSSDPLDSDDDNLSLLDRRAKIRNKTTKSKETQKDKDKKPAPAKVEPVKAKRGWPPKNKTENTVSAKLSTVKSATSKMQKEAGGEKEKTKKDKEDGDDIDKEIEKLSKLPSMQTKRQKSKKDEDKDDKEDEDEGDKSSEENGEKEDKKGKTAKNSKPAMTFEDLSSDGEDDMANKADSEEEYDEADNSLEPTVTFAIDNADLLDEQANLSAKNGLLEETIDDEEDDDKEGSSDEGKSNDEDNSSEDEDDEHTQKKKRKGKAKKDKEETKSDKDENSDNDEEEEVEEDEDNIGRTKRTRNKLLDTKLSESDSDVGTSKKKKGKDDDFKAESSSGSSLESESDKEEDSEEDEEEDNDEEEKGSKKKGKKGKKRKGKKKKGSDAEDEEEEEEGSKGKKGKKRKRIKKMSDSSNEDKEKDEDDQDASGFGKRKKIRKVMSNKKLEDSTKAAAKAEERRRKRIAAKQREFNVETITDENNPMNAPITTKLILEPGKEEGDDPLIQVNKKLIRKLKPHQVDAVQFMWDCLYESVKRSKKEEGAGCILAHCMGLGKTLSVISFVHTVLSHEKHLKQRTCLVVSPLNTVLNWRNEWTMWLDKKDQLEVWELASCKQNVARADTLKEWQESGGIMIIGYEMYRNLTTGARIKNKRQKKVFQECLVDPGPDLCVCDEGHILKNENSSLSKSMNTMKTRRRIVLTGTPLQNNLNEYHCMVSFVKPNLLGTRKEFNNRFISPIQNGQCTDSTLRDVRIMKARAHVLHEMLAGCVQRRDYSALTKFLPPKQEYVISVRLTPVQMELYEKYLELTGQGVDGVFNNKGARLFKDYQSLMKIWTHPWVLKLAEIRDELKMKYDDDEDSFIDDNTSDEDRSFSSSSSESDEEKIVSDSGDEEGSNKGPNGKGTKRTRAKARRQAGEDSDPEEVIAEWKSKMRKDDKDAESSAGPEVPDRISKEWWAQYVCEDDKAKIELSNKLYLLFEILRMCEEIGDKVLIFSQSILSLNIIEDFLETVDSKFQAEMDKKAEEDPDDETETDQFGKSWTKNLDYYRMDGSTSAQNRQIWAENFNDVDNYRARLFLISTKAGGLGINLVAANRVIIFDASWNPSHDVQSIFRVYRFGQTKPCYIYRFLAQGTMEEKIYERQVTKLSLSQRVVDEHQIERHFSANDLRELYSFRPERWEEDGEHATLALPKDPLLAEVLKTHRHCVVSFHEHDSLLENQIEQTLTEEEKKAAWEEYENEKKGIIVRGPGMESMGRTASWPMMAAAQILSKEQIAATVHALRQQLPDLPEEVFHMHVQQALRRQVQMKQDEMRRMEMMRMQELSYLNMMQQGAMGFGGTRAMQNMQNMAPWMQIQHLRAMQNQLMQGRSGYGMGAVGGHISNRPEEAINLDEPPSKQ